MTTRMGANHRVQQFLKGERRWAIIEIANVGSSPLNPWAKNESFACGSVSWLNFRERNTHS